MVQEAIQDPTFHLVFMAHWLPVGQEHVLGLSSIFHDFDIFEELFASYFCNVPYFRCLVSPHDRIQVMHF